MSQKQWIAGINAVSAALEAGQDLGESKLRTFWRVTLPLSMGGVIAAVGVGLQTRGEVLRAAGCVVTPGLVNTHHHLYQTLTRAVPGGQDALLFGWLKTLYPIWAGFGPEEMFVSTQTGLAELALSGCTLTSDHLYLFPNGARLDDTIAAVKSGEADAVFADRDALKPFSEGQDLVWAGENVTLDQGIGIGIRKSDTELKAKFNTAIESMKADGTLNTAIKKWFGDDAATF